MLRIEGGCSSLLGNILIVFWHGLEYMWFECFKYKPDSTSVIYRVKPQYAIKSKLLQTQHMPRSCTNGRNPSPYDTAPETDPSQSQSDSDSESDSETDDEEEFQDMLKIEARWNKSKISKFEQTHITVALFIKDRSGWKIWQYPLPRWNQYLAWKQQREDEAEFLFILKLETRDLAVCTLQQYQFNEKTAELVVKHGTTVGVWQYSESYWNRYLAWKQAHLAASTQEAPV